MPTCDLHIAGWGPNAARFGGDEAIIRLFVEDEVTLYALAVNKDGSPKHPLYIGYAVQPVIWR
jgi:hypothetical protein